MDCTSRAFLRACHWGAGVHAFAPPLTYASIAPLRTMGIRLRLGFGE